MSSGEGRVGRTGATGDTGRAGARGEQGPIGDPGETGQQGAPGVSGDEKQARKLQKLDRTTSILFVIVMLTLFAIGWGTDYTSCRRQVPIRAESNNRTIILRDFLNTAAYAREQSARTERASQRRIDLTAARRWRIDALALHNVTVPKCLAFLPPAVAR